MTGNGCNQIRRPGLSACAALVVSQFDTAIWSNIVLASNATQQRATPQGYIVRSSTSRLPDPDSTMQSSPSATDDGNPPGTE